MLRLAVVAHPSARIERVERLSTGELGVWVRAKPVDGKANEAIEAAIAAALGLRPRQVRIVGGTTSRRKIVELDLPQPADLDDRLMAYGLLPRSMA